MLLPDEDPAELDNEENIWRLLSAFDVRPDNAKMERHTIYRFESAWATQWRNGRVFIMGDAAHKMPPFAGQGLASGVRDAINLAWKLDLVLQGKAQDALLDSYTSERSVHIKDMIDFSIQLGSIICIPDEAAAAARDAAMLADIEAGVQAAPPPKPRLGEGLWHGATGGYLSWQGRVSTAAHPDVDRFDDVIGPGALILRDADMAKNLDSSTVSTLRSLGIDVVTVDASGSSRDDVTAVNDVDGHYANWFLDMGAGAALVRPDFYVFGSAESAGDVATLAKNFIHEVTGK
jgi:3-(3-hydroxy-phenyl)propionate hydroxylase